MEKGREGLSISLKKQEAFYTVCFLFFHKSRFRPVWLTSKSFLNSPPSIVSLGKQGKTHICPAIRDFSAQIPPGFTITRILKCVECAERTSAKPFLCFFASEGHFILPNYSSRPNFSLPRCFQFNRDIAVEPASLESIFQVNFFHSREEHA